MRLYTFRTVHVLATKLRHSVHHRTRIRIGNSSLIPSLLRRCSLSNKRMRAEYDPWHLLILQNPPCACSCFCSHHMLDPPVAKPARHLANSRSNFCNHHPPDRPAAKPDRHCDDQTSTPRRVPRSYPSSILTLRLLRCYCQYSWFWKLGSSSCRP